jgi:hypothetical protein
MYITVQSLIMIWPGFGQVLVGLCHIIHYQLCKEWIESKSEDLGILLHPVNNIFVHLEFSCQCPSLYSYMWNILIRKWKYLECLIFFRAIKQPNPLTSIHHIWYGLLLHVILFFTSRLISAGSHFQSLWQRQTRIEADMTTRNMKMQSHYN